MTGVAFADSAGVESVLLTDLEPGGYIAICMIPVGGGETGDPHAAHGMVAEFEVSVMEGTTAVTAARATVTTSGAVA